MKRLILLLFLALSGYLIAQDIKPINPEFKQLQTPNNAVFWYNQLDSSLWVFKGKTGWLRIASNNQIIRVQAAINYLDGKDVNSVSVTGTGTKTITVARVNGSTLTATFEDAGGTQLQSDWTQTNTLSVDYIKNKPTALSNFTNDLGFIGDAPANGYMYGRKNNAWEQITSLWTADTYGLTYANNIGFGVASNVDYRLNVLGSKSSRYIAKISNSNANGYGLLVNTANNGNLGNILTLNAADTKAFNFRCDNVMEIAYNTAGTLTPSSGYGLLYAKNADGHLWWKNAAGSEWDLTLSGSGSGTPGGSSGAIQYNNGGAFGGFGSWNGSTMSLTGAISATGNITASGSGAAIGTSNGGAIGMTSGYFYIPNRTAPSTPTSGLGYIYLAGTAGFEHVYLKTANETFDLTQIGSGLTNPMTTIGDMIYGTTGGAAARLAAGADGYYLRMQSGVPTWVASSYTLPTASNSVLGGVKISSTDGGISMFGDYAALNINNLTSSSLDLSDYFAFYDGSGTATRKATLNDLKTLVGSGSTGGAPTDATYITQTANASLTNEQALGSLATGIMKSTNTTGVVSTLTGTAKQYLRRNASNTDFEFGDLPSFTNYWQSGSGYIEPTTITDEVRIGSTSDLGLYNLQVEGSAIVNNGRLIVNGNSYYGFEATGAAGAARLYNSSSSQATLLGKNSGGGYVLLAESSNSTTNTSLPVLDIYRSTTGTPQNGIGSYLSFSTNTTSGNSSVHEYSRIETIATDITNGSGNAEMNIYLDYQNVMTKRLTISDIGNLSVTGSAKVGNDSTTASASNVGAIRYRTSGNNSYCEMVMQTGASTYDWVIIKQNSW